VEAPVLRLPADNGGALAIRHVAGNIGGEILRRFVVTFDYARRIVHLVANAESGKPFEVDRSGLWINRHAQGAVVGAVMAGSPADTAGVLVDDVIVAIDGAQASGIGLDALRRLLANSPIGTRMAFDLRRGESQIQAALELRDLV
jgi:S1-C subfamily serine protease